MDQDGRGPGEVRHGEGAQQTNARMQRSTGLPFWLVMGGLVLLGAWFFGRNGGSFVTGALPSIDSVGTWINTPGSIDLDDFAGDVIWLEFGFLH